MSVRAGGAGVGDGVEDGVGGGGGVWRGVAREVVGCFVWGGGEGRWWCRQKAG